MSTEKNRETKFLNIVEGLFWNPSINVLNEKAASFTTTSLQGVDFENLSELSQRLGTKNISVIAVKDMVTVVIKQLPPASKWKTIKARKLKGK